jgi:hypothetical protein
LVVAMSGRFEGSLGEPQCVLDPFTLCELNFVTTCKDLGNTTRTWAFHIDRHIAEPLLGRSYAGFDDYHPLYHVQFGGRNVQAAAAGGGFVLLDAPRFLTPPLDPLLAIDLLLSSFAPEAWKNCGREPDYQAYVSASLRKIWAPFFGELARLMGDRGPTHKFPRDAATALVPSWTPEKVQR